MAYLYLFLFFILTPNLVLATSLDKFLQDVANNTAPLRIVQAEESSDLMANDAGLGVFDWSLALEGNFTRSDDTPTSPFSSNKTLKREYSLSASKLWRLGIQSELSYGLTDNFTGFPTRAAQDYYKPELKLNLKTDLIRDVFGARYLHRRDRVAADEAAIRASASIKRKDVLAQSILLLAQYLQFRDDLTLQRELCLSIERQTKKLRQKQKRGSIARRDYLVSKKEANECRAAIAQIETQSLDRKERLQVNYNIAVDEYEKLEVSKLFIDIIDLVKRPEYLGNKVDFDSNDDVRRLDKQIEANSLRQVSLDADTRMNLGLEVEVSYAGLNSNLGSSHSDITSSKFTGFYAGLSMEFPFATREAKTKAIVNRYNGEILHIRKQQLALEKNSRFQFLQETIRVELESYNSYIENVELSREILKEARREFNNGRIDFFNLTEFQKRLTQSQQKLSALRSQLVVDVVEYVDFFNYFEKFSLGKR